MQKLTFSTSINASKERVWEILWSDVTYRAWTSAFAEGSYAKTDNWKEGTRVLFLDPKGSGMVSKVAKNVPNEFMSFEHLGEVRDGVEDTTSDRVKEWAGATENYTLKEENGKTTLTIEMDITDEFKEMFEKMWPPALKNVKELSEARNKAITVESVVKAPVEKVWKNWTEPGDITKWCNASDDWHAPHAENDVRTGGRFKTVMAAKDGSMSFDFTGTYDNVKKFETIEYKMDDGRQVKIRFQKLADKETKVVETFEMENENPEEIQRGGWQAILDNFKNYAETSAN